MVIGILVYKEILAEYSSDATTSYNSVLKDYHLHTVYRIW